MKEIGSGSYGVVWGALNEHTEEVVAIKQLKMKYNSVEECMNLTEVKALRQMDHPNIVKLKDIIKEHDSLYLVFEYMECSLYERMKYRKKPFSEDEIRNLCFQIFQGLGYMHNNGYFHRDLKPENLLVSKEVIKIADLGLAGETNQQPYTVNVGSRWYKAPEVLLGQRYDSSVDMWAMGVIMAELFTGGRLFPGKNDGDQMYKICSVIGSPTETTLSMVNSNYQFPQLPGVQLSSLLPCASLEALDLIATLLSWSPSARPTAMKALDHPFFNTWYHVLPSFQGNPFYGFETEDSLENLTGLLPENIFCGSETEDSSEDLENPFCVSKTEDRSENLICLLPENLFYGSKSEDSLENLTRLLPENPFCGYETEDSLKNLIRQLPENPFYGSETGGSSENLSPMFLEIHFMVPKL
ncbi:unnamed protein product [Lactuca saligna]|uniref:Protein kinase domain-containing protein n=1 Tax=Lactuca saligna TaxID=75948 RepID=A0AA36EA52_LACSI|nr:unnamed protein product [Lactuca saligna]